MRLRSLVLLFLLARCHALNGQQPPTPTVTLKGQVLLSDGTPLADRFVLVKRTKDFEWIEPSGKRRSGHGSLSNWIKTDERGIASFGAAGDCEVRVSDGDWRETKGIKDPGGDLIRLEFHRPAIRKLFGRVRGNDQRELVEKDYMILKIDLGRDANADQIAKQLDVGIESIPWMAITDADGDVLADSESEIGNIGFPSKLESLRHFRKMLASTRKHMTDAQLDAVIDSRR